MDERARRLVRHGYRRLARSPLRVACDSRLVTGLMTPLLEMTAPDVLRVLDACAEAGIQGWVGGGWGVDALLGRQSRRHGDLDLIVADDPWIVGTAHRVICALGLEYLMERRTPTLMPRRMRFAGDDGRSIDLLPVDVEAPPFDTSNKGAPPFAAGMVAGRSVPCLSEHLQRRLHAGYPPRVVDGRDLVRLSQHLSGPAPAPASGTAQ